MFFFMKEFETGCLRTIDAKNFGRIVKKCLGFPQTVRPCDFSLSQLLSSLSVAETFAIKDKTLQLHD